MTSTAPAPERRSEFQDMWRTRPIRTPDDKKIAGVCGGVGRRYRVDPVLVRVAFVVATLWGGVGLFFYVAAWLLLPAQGDTASPLQALLGRGHASTSKSATVALGLLAVIAAPTLGGASHGFFVGAGLVATLGLFGGWYALYRRTPEPPAGWAEVMTAPAGTVVPPSWDPLGAAPFAWDLPDPGPAPAPRRPRSAVTPVTLSVAAIVTAVAIGLRALAGVEALTDLRIAALALAVMGAGLLVGAARRRGHGLLVVALPLAGIVLVGGLASRLPDAAQRIGAGYGDNDARSTTVTISDESDLRTVHSDLGAVRVDLTGLRPTTYHSIEVGSDLGEVSVALPPGLDVRVTCSSDLGTVDCPQGLDVGDDGRRGPVLTIDAHSNLGDVQVRR